MGAGTSLEPGPGPAAPPKPSAGPILSLTARPSSAHGALVSAAATGAPAGDEIRALRLGQAPEPQSGRADDFTWTRTQ